MNALKHAGFAVLFIVLSAAAAPAQDTPADHPLKRAKVGDYVQYEAAGPSLGGFGGAKASSTLYLRYTVAAKTEKEATLKVQTWAGEAETSASEMKVPLDRAWEPDLLRPPSDAKEAPKVTLEKKSPQQYKLYGRTFDCTAYIYSMKVPLFSKLLPNKPKDDGKGGDVEVRLGYLVSPEAPVLGLVVFSMDFGGDLKTVYRLNSGTGVADLFKVATAPKAARRLAGRVGDYMEYEGQVRGDQRKVTLRHTVLRAEEEGLVVRVELKVEGELVGEKEVLLKTDCSTPALALTPPWPEIGLDPEQPAKPFGVASDRSVRLFNGLAVKGKDATHEFPPPAGPNGKPGKKPQVNLFTSEELPLSGLGTLRFSGPLLVELKLSGSKPPLPAGKASVPAKKKGKDK